MLLYDLIKKNDPSFPDCPVYEVSNVSDWINAFMKDPEFGSSKEKQGELMAPVGAFPLDNGHFFLEHEISINSLHLFHYLDQLGHHDIVGNAAEEDEVTRFGVLFNVDCFQQHKIVGNIRMYLGTTDPFAFEIDVFAETLIRITKFGRSSPNSICFDVDDGGLWSESSIPIFNFNSPICAWPYELLVAMQTFQFANLHKRCAVIAEIKPPRSERRRKIRGEYCRSPYRVIVVQGVSENNKIETLQQVLRYGDKGLPIKRGHRAVYPGPGPEHLMFGKLGGTFWRLRTGTSYDRLYEVQVPKCL